VLLAWWALSLARRDGVAADATLHS
jgi:hypothetical protein